MDFKALGMGVAFAFMWSSAFTSARIIVAHAPPMLTLSVRFALSGLIAIAIAWALGQRMSLTKEQWRATLIFGLCQNALYLGLNFMAMQTVEASLAAIVAASLPLWVAGFGWVLFAERLSGLGLVGLLAGFGGVALIMGSRVTGGADAFGVMLCLIGVLALTFATLALRSASSGGNLWFVIGVQMLVGGAVLLPFGVLFEAPVVEMSWSLIAAFTYTVLVPGLLATWVWFLLVNRIGMVRAATYHFLNPAFGVAVAAILLSEVLSATDLVGVVVATLGILLVQLARTHR